MRKQHKLKDFLIRNFKINLFLNKTFRIFKKYVNHPTVQLYYVSEFKIQNERL